MAHIVVLLYCYAKMNLRINQDHRYFYKRIGVTEIIKCIRLKKTPTINISLYKEAGRGKPRKALAQLLPSCTTGAVRSTNRVGAALQQPPGVLRSISAHALCVHLQLIVFSNIPRQKLEFKLVQPLLCAEYRLPCFGGGTHQLLRPTVQKGGSDL